MKRFTKYLFCSIIFFATYNVSHAQTIRISGEIVNDSLDRIVDAVISLVQEEGARTHPTTAVVSDATGKFQLSIEQATSAVLKIEHLSYKSLLLDIEAVRDTSIIIQMETNTYSLGNVTVYGKRKTITYREDGNIVVAVENLPGYNTRSSADMMRKLPGVMFASDGSLLLNGQPVKLMMDGRDIEVGNMTLLNSLPAIALGEIELISNVTAQYDASSPRIINIISKKNRENGYNLYFGANRSVDREGRGGGGANAFIMVKHNRFHFNNTLSYETSPGHSTGTDTAYYSSAIPSSLAQQYEYRHRANRVMNNTNLSYEMKRGHSLGLNLFAFYGIEDRESYTDEKWSNEASSRRYNFVDDPNNFLLSGNIAFRTSDQLPFKLISSYGFVRGKGRNTQDMHSTLGDVDDAAYRYKKDELGLQHTGKIDFTQNLFSGKATITVGTKGDFSSLSNNDIYDIHYGSLDLPNVAFEGRENIIGIYTTLTYRPNDKLSLYAGVRGEYTDYQMDLKSTGESSSNQYWNFVPSTYITYRPSSAYSGTLGLFGGIMRPNYEFLMPGTHYEGEYEYQTGNPKLNARQYYNIALRNVLFEFITLNVIGIYNKNRITSVKIDKGGGVTENTYMNSVDSRSVEVNVGIPFAFAGKRISGQVNYNYWYGKYINPRNGFHLLKDREIFAGMNSTLYANFDVVPRVSVNGYLSYYIKSKNLQTDMKNYATLDLGIQYGMLKKENLILSFNVSDVLNSRQNHLTYYYDNVRRVRNSVSNWQCFTLNVSYRFGGGKSPKRDPSDDPNDTSRFGT